jgi:hypothetical protein
VPLYNAPAFEESKEVITMETKERALWAATALRFVGSAASVCFMWSVIVVNTLETLPDWHNLIALGLLGMAIGTNIASELLARRFRQLVGDAPGWRARLSRNTALIRVAEYLLSMQVVPAMLRLIFADTPYPWLSDVLGLAALGYLAMAAVEAWELVRAEITLTRLADRWTTQANISRDLSVQNFIVWGSLLLVVGVALFIPGQVALIPGSIADVVQTSLIVLLIVIAGIAGWNLAVAVLRRWQRDDRLVTR